MQQRSRARFMVIEDGLHLCLGGIELGKEGLDARDNAPLLVEGRQQNWITNQFLLRNIGLGSPLP